MRIEFDRRLIEESVFLALQATSPSPGLEQARYHRLADPIYKVADTDQRERAFSDLHRDMFIRLDLQRTVNEVITCFPNMSSGADVLAFVCVERKKDEEAELFHNAEQKFSILFRMRPETLVSSMEFKRVAFHELLRVDDMLNPSFDYSPSFMVPGVNPEQQDMIRDRYRALWEIYIEARLLKRQRPHKRSREGHEMNFMRLFGLSDTTQTIFGRLWTCQFGTETKNRTLIEAAQTPEALARWAGLEISACSKAAIRCFSAVCPLCGCPTSDWVAKTDLLDQALIEQIRKLKPGWVQESGLCGQCKELLQVNTVTAAAG